MSAYVMWRLVKWLGLSLFAAGCIGSATAASASDRARYAFGAATLGWVLTWIAGYGLVKTTSIEMSEPWVTAGMGFSFLALLGAVLSASLGRKAVWSVLTVGGFGASVAVMALRTVPMMHPIALGVGLLTGVACLALRSPTCEAGHDSAAMSRWFEWMGRFEGLSLLALFGVYMPAKYLLHIHLDGGQGWFGWAHGLLFVGYVVALASMTFVEGWPLSRAALGFVASLVPFGTFLFERRMHTWRS